MKNKIKNIIDKIKNYFKTFTFKKFLKVLLLVVEIMILIIIINLNKLIGNWCYLIWGLLLLLVIIWATLTFIIWVILMAIVKVIVKEGK